MDTIYHLDTPARLVDLDVMEDNLIRMQEYCNQHKLGLRPPMSIFSDKAIFFWKTGNVTGNVSGLLFYST